MIPLYAVGNITPARRFLGQVRICPNLQAFYGQDHQDQSSPPHHVYPNISMNTHIISSVDHLDGSTSLLCQDFHCANIWGRKRESHPCQTPCFLHNPHTQSTVDSTFQAIDAANWTSILQIIVDGMAGRYTRHFRYCELPIRLRV